MNFFTKTRVLVTIIVVLAVLNITILGTVGYQFYKSKSIRNDDRPRKEHPGRFVARQMNMSDDQFKKFEESRVKFIDESNQIMHEIRHTSKLILDEISSDNPDSAKLKELTESFGNLHKHQKQMMIEHLLTVKSNCTPDQLKHFNKFIRRMESVEIKRGRRERNRQNQDNK